MQKNGEKAKGIDPKNDPDFKDALSDVLSFYGMQLQSHAAILISLLIAIFAVLSLKPTGTRLILSDLVISLLVVVAAHTSLRLVVYGGLSSRILYGSFESVNRSLTIQEWENYLPQTLVSKCAHSQFKEIWRDKKHLRVLDDRWFLNGKDQPRIGTLFIIGGITFFFTIIFSFVV